MDYFNRHGRVEREGRKEGAREGRMEKGRDE